MQCNSKTDFIYLVIYWAILFCTAVGKTTQLEWHLDRNCPVSSPYLCTYLSTRVGILTYWRTLCKTAATAWANWERWKPIDSYSITV